MSIYEGLSAEFPRDAISWRAQSVTQDGTKAMALAYIDARDVMDRLDEVVGFENWQDRYEFHGTRTVCYLSLKIGDEWITKADGAGDSDVEAEKGAISDALKRAAVKWGIGRYLYHLKSPWVPCESYDKGGKKYWKKWTDDPWKFVRGEAAKPPQSDPKPKETSKPVSSAQNKRHLETIERELIDCHTPNDVTKLLDSWIEQAQKEGWSQDYWNEAKAKFARRRRELVENTVEDIQETFPGARVVNEKVLNVLDAG